MEPAGTKIEEEMQKLLPRLRDERHRRARAARRPRRPQAIAAARPRRHARPEPGAKPRSAEVRQDLRRHVGQLPPARRGGHLPHPGAHGADLQHARTRWWTARATLAQSTTIPPAAMRYTEARLTPLAIEMLADIDRDTVDWQPNYDGRLQEPTVLPGRFPNLLCNGSAGHRGRHGDAASRPTTCPRSCDALVALIDKPEATVEDLDEARARARLPDRGHRCSALEDVRTAYATGHGRVVIRARRLSRSPEAGASRSS